MSYILDDLVELGVDEIVFVIGYLGDVVKEYMAREYPGITAHYVVQEVQDGTAGAVKLAEPWADEELLISSWTPSSTPISPWPAPWIPPGPGSSGPRRWRTTSASGSSSPTRRAP
jgi:UTP-glucose-1-phosphate uridylyltransferase